MPRPLPNAFRPLTNCFIAPQLATFAATVPTGEDWIYERKYDGHRLQVHITAEGIRCFTRRGTDITALLAPLLPSIGRLPVDTAVLDGELCAWSDDETTDLGRLNATLHHHGPFRFFAFDILELDGEDLTPLPLSARKRHLAALFTITPCPFIQQVQYQRTNGAQLFDQMLIEGHEGIIAKRADAPYRPGVRLPEWRKIKVTQEHAFPVIGWQTDATNTFMTSLVLAQNTPAPSDDPPCLQYRGRVGTGFSVTQRQHLHQLLSKHASNQPPCTVPTHLRSARWCRGDRLGTANIRFADVSSHGVLRSPTFIGWDTTPGC